MHGMIQTIKCCPSSATVWPGVATACVPLASFPQMPGVSSSSRGLSLLQNGGLLPQLVESIMRQELFLISLGFCICEGALGL